MSVENVVLHVADVQKSFAGLHALADIDLSVREGETHAIIGPNGAGKSTLLNVCIGRLKPEIFPELSLLENVMVPILAKRDGSFKLNVFKRFYSEKEVQSKAEHILDDVGLGDFFESEAGSLSRGDKRRLELAMGLAQEPRLLLLDEPTAGMARHDTNATIDLLKRIKARGMTKVIIEHDMHVVFSLADRITVLAGGRIICQGTPEEVKADPRVKEAYLGEEQV